MNPRRIQLSLNFDSWRSAWVINGRNYLMMLYQLAISGQWLQWLSVSDGRSIGDDDVTTCTETSSLSIAAPAPASDNDIYTSCECEQLGDDLIVTR